MAYPQARSRAVSAAGCDAYNARDGTLRLPGRRRRHGRRLGGILACRAWARRRPRAGGCGRLPHDRTLRCHVHANLWRPADEGAGRHGPLIPHRPAVRLRGLAAAQPARSSVCRSRRSDRHARSLLRGEPAASADSCTPRRQPGAGAACAVARGLCRRRGSGAGGGGRSTSPPCIKVFCEACARVAER